MADEDLVSEVRIEGLPQAEAGLLALGAAGQTAFATIDGAAARSGKSLSSWFTQMRSGAKALQQLRPAPGALGSIEAMSSGFGKLTSGLGRAATASNRFIMGSRRVATMAAAVSGGLIAGARLAAKSYDEAGKSQDSQTDAQIRAAQTAQATEKAQFSYRQSVQGLNRDLANGKLSFSEYDQAIQDLNFSYKQSQKEAEFTRQQEEALREETQRLQATAAKQEAFGKLADTFGGTLAGSLITAGRAADTFIGDMQRSLGPAVSGIVNRVVALFEQNRAKIIATFDSIAAKIDAFVQGGGVERAFTVIGQAVGTIANIIQNAVIPAINSFVAALQPVAAAINAVFGTELTGGGLAIVVLVGLMTRAFTVLFALLKAGGGAFQIVLSVLLRLPQALGFAAIGLRGLAVALRLVVASLGPIGLAIAAVMLAFAAFEAMGGDITKVWAALVTFFGTTLPQAISSGVSSILQGITTFFGTTLPDAISSALKSLGEIVAAGWKWIVDASIAVWNGLVNFFTVTLPDAIRSGLQFIADTVNGIWTSITQTFQNVWNAAVEFVMSKLGGLFTFAQSLLSLLDKIKSKANNAAGGGEVKAAGGGHIRGPGTSTSDSIPAWLSNNEWVIRARAVRKYGHAFMRSVNNGTFNPGGAFQHALGGLAGSVSRPRFADGGPVQAPAAGGRPIVLNLPGGESFPVTASEDSARGLIKYAVRRQTRSTGRKPQWVGR